jgi:hypothetical protein
VVDLQRGVGDPVPVSAHVLVNPAGDCHAVRRDLEELLSERQ